MPGRGDHDGLHVVLRRGEGGVVEGRGGVHGGVAG